MPKQAVPVLTVVYAKSLPKVSAFYEQTLRLERAEVEATHILLSNGEIEVAVIQALESIAGALVVAVPPEPRVATPLKVSFAVEEFARVREAAEATGGSLKPEQAAWSWRGYRHLDGNDPEGNIVQFRVVETAPGV